MHNGAAARKTNRRTNEGKQTSTRDNTGHQRLLHPHAEQQSKNQNRRIQPALQNRRPGNRPLLVCSATSHTKIRGSFSIDWLRAAVFLLSLSSLECQVIASTPDARNQSASQHQRPGNRPLSVRNALRWITTSLTSVTCDPWRAPVCGFLLLPVPLSASACTWSLATWRNQLDGNGEVTNSSYYFTIINTGLT